MNAKSRRRRILPFVARLRMEPYEDDTLGARAIGARTGEFHVPLLSRAAARRRGTKRWKLDMGEFAMFFCPPALCDVNDCAKGKRKVTARSIVISLMMFALAILFPGVGSAGGQWQDLGGGWKFRVDPPHTGPDTGKYHVHVNKGNNEVGSEGVDGSASHNDHMNNVPGSIKDKVKDHPEYKKGQKKQEDLDKARRQINDKKLKIDLQHVADVGLAISIVIACTATVFFPGDDIPAWINFLRAIGAGANA